MVSVLVLIATKIFIQSIIWMKVQKNFRALLNCFLLWDKSF